MPGKDQERRLLKAQATVTTSFAGWSSDWLDVGWSMFGVLLLELVKADAESFSVRLLGEDGTQEAGYRLVEGETWDRAIAASDLETEDRVALRLPIDWCRRIKVQLRKAGGTGAPTAEAHLLTVVR